MASSAASPPPASVVPAQLGFLAIFNPSLSADDETLDDQIVYYASVTARGGGGSGGGSRRRARPSRGKPTEGLAPEERNERLRQIGLAQGMVDFSRGFSNGKPVDTIETEKSRVVLKELEPGWWILAVSCASPPPPSPPPYGRAPAVARSRRVGALANTRAVSTVHRSDKAPVAAPPGRRLEFQRRPL